MNGEAKEPASPCVGVCKMDPATGLCRGCRRTLDEIANWTAFSTAQKSAVLERFDERQKNVKKIFNFELPSKQFQAALSVPLYIEYQDVLTRPENMTGRSSRDEIVSFLRYLCSICYRQDVFFLWRSWLKDPKDDMVLELAVASNSRYIVTHNIGDFKDIDGFSVKAVTPREFIEILKGT